MAEYIDIDQPLIFKDIRNRDVTGTIRTILKANHTKLVLADVVPVRHGRWGNRWICSNMTGYEYACSCSECNKSTYRISAIEPMPPYCPNCGALMQEEDDGN